tara:strand:+ start:817 stop:1374 length:558 start_codon:yes stop_codon:yes gene_type:complete
VTQTELYKELNYVNHSRKKRQYYANLVIKQPELIPLLLDILSKTDDKLSARAAWVLEFLCKEHLNKFTPYIDVFLPLLHRVKIDSALRPCAKICEYMADAYFGKEPHRLKQTLIPNQKETIIEACFDWMITEQKVAVKAYSMHILFLFGKEFDWIYPELRVILERDFHEQSAAFKARSRHILKKI